MSEYDDSGSMGFDTFDAPSEPSTPPMRPMMPPMRRLSMQAAAPAAKPGCLCSDTKKKMLLVGAGAVGGLVVSRLLMR